MTCSEREWDAVRIRSECTRRLVDIEMGTCRGLVKVDRFNPAWVGLLLQRAESLPKVANPEAMLSSWFQKRTWRVQMLFLMATKFGLWDTVAAGQRFKRCRELHKAGLEPWMLLAIHKAIEVEEAVEDKRAYLASILREKAWVMFYERVDMEEQGREVTNDAVLTICKDVLRGIKRRQMDAAWERMEAEAVS